MFRSPCIAILLAVLLGGCTNDVVQKTATAGCTRVTIITNASIVDGTGADARQGAVRLCDDRIVEVGKLDARAGENVIDAQGLVLSPGFIDTHSHHDDKLFDQPDVIEAVSQGITTIVVGQDGGSTLPLKPFFTRVEAEPPALNVAQA